MSGKINEQTWHHLTEQILSGMREWREQHPKATLRQIETELDARWARLRARMLEDMALTSAAADWADTQPAHQPTCPDCGLTLQMRGTDTRSLQTHGGQELRLTRHYGVCPACGAGLFPLDDELGLLPGSLTPRLNEALVRLSTHIPSFANPLTLQSYHPIMIVFKSMNGLVNTCSVKS